MEEDVEKIEFSEDYKKCLELSQKLNGWEQFNLAMQLMNNFQEQIKEREN